MGKRLTALLFTCWLTGAVWAQAPDIRNPDIGDNEQGQMLTDAGISEDPAQKIAILEAFVQKFPTDPNVGYAYLQLQTLNLDAQKFDKAAEYSDKLIKLAPNDLEVRHNAIRALEGAGQYDKLVAMAGETKAMAEKQNDDYGKQVVEYIEYSLFSSAIKATDPKAKIALIDALRASYPNGKYSNSPDAINAYVMAAQQTGNMDKAVEMLEAAVKANPSNPNEVFLYMLGDAALNKREFDKAKTYGEQLVQVMGTKPKPDNVAADAWERQKKLFTGLGYFVLGRMYASKEQYKEGREALLKAVEPLQAQGGQPYGVLAYYLGICYVKLDVQGDNIPAATKWMTVAAQTENPFQAEAKKTLAAIKKAQ